MSTNGVAPGHGHEGPHARAITTDQLASGSIAPHTIEVSPLASSNLTEAHHSDHALEMDFYRRFHSAVAACRDFSLNLKAFAPSPPAIPSKLSELLKDPDNRSCAWRFIGTMGISDTFGISERRALCAGLLTYVKQDKDECVIPLIEIALYAADQKDMELYKAVGEVARAAGIGELIADSTIAGFCSLNSYNAARQPEFHPWIEIFAASNSLPVYQQLASTLEDRVQARQPGTYDHLLRTLCISDSPHTVSVIRSLVAIPLPPSADMIPKPTSWVIGLGVGIPIGVGLVAIHSVLDGALALARSENVWAALVTTPLTPQAWFIGGMVGTITGLFSVTTAWLLRAEIVSHNEGMRAHLLSHDYHHMAERIYARLGEAAPTNQNAKPLRRDMESCDAYAAVIDTWRQRYPLCSASDPIDGTTRE